MDGTQVSLYERREKLDNEPNSHQGALLEAARKLEVEARVALRQAVVNYDAACWLALGDNASETGRLRTRAELVNACQLFLQAAKAVDDLEHVEQTPTTVTAPPDSDATPPDRYAESLGLVARHQLCSTTPCSHPKVERSPLRDHQSAPIYAWQCRCLTCGAKWGEVSKPRHQWAPTGNDGQLWHRCTRCGARAQGSSNYGPEKQYVWLDSWAPSACAEDISSQVHS